MVTEPDFSSLETSPFSLHFLAQVLRFEWMKNEWMVSSPRCQHHPLVSTCSATSHFHAEPQTFLGIIVPSVPDTSKILKVGKECSVSVWGLNEWMKSCPCWICWAGAAGRPPEEFIFPPTRRDEIMAEKIILLSLKWGLGGVSPMPEAVLKAQPTHPSHCEWIKIRYFIM